MDPGKIFQIITNSTLLATRLFSGEREPIQFSEPRYCSVVSEDAVPSASVVKVSASHKSGATVRYSITGGNKDGLFTIDQHSGLITLSATLDYELQRKHELVVSAEAEGSSVHSFVAVSVADVNDNPPRFLHTDAKVTILEGEDEDLPKTIFKVIAEDADKVDAGRLIYSVGGEGVGVDPSESEPFFSINPHSGELLQLKSLDRDPPNGKASWKLRVQVRDGQRVPSSLAEATRRMSRRSPHPRPLYRRLQQQQLLLQNVKGVSSPGTVIQPYQKMGNESRLEIVNEKPSLFPTGSIEGFSSSTKGSLSIAESLHFSSSSSSSPFSPSLPLGQETLPESVESQTNISSSGKSKNVMGEFDNGGKSSQLGRYDYITLTGNQTKNDPLGTMTHSDLDANRNVNTQDRYFQAYHNVASDSTMKFSDRLRPQRRIRKLRQVRMLEDGATEVTPSSTTTHQILAENPSTDVAGNIRILPPNSPEPSRHPRGNIPLNQLREPSEESPSSSPSSKYQKLLIPSPSLSSSRSSSRKSSMKKPSPIHLEPGENSTGVEIKEMERGNSLVAAGSKIKRSVPRVPEGGGRGGGGEGEGGGTPLTRLLQKKKKETDSLKTRLSQGSIMKDLKALPGPLDYPKRFTTEGIGSCEDYTSFSFNFDIDEIPKFGRGGFKKDKEGEGEEEEEEEDPDLEEDLGSHMLGEDDESGHVHVVETVVTVVVKDLNDNPPLFPNVTIVGEVQENGPIDLSVAYVTAWDADDVDEGTNARLTYSIGKNVLEERTGQAIFAIHPETGLLTTAVCCLDRETTPEYHIQVVAVDGGGLTGTGQVSVRLADVNDNSPRLSRDQWEVDVEESWGGEQPSNKTLTQFTTVDHDISNYFFYRVVEESGWGWQYFDVRSRGHIGELYSTHPLDYEDSAHRRGFRFMIQVTDRGRGGWDDPRHKDTAWVSVHLIDINDNPPQFSQPQIHLTLQENVAPGTVLTNLVAQDPDMGGQQEVSYSVVGGWGALTVNADGVVRLWRALDREMAGGDVGVAKVIAVDDGDPPLTSTATLTITVTDVNDCPPRLLPPTLLHVTEGRPAARLGLLRATDDDVWALGHGPPFYFSLPPSNPSFLFQTLALKYNSSEDSGRGGAELWTMGPLDREQYPQLTVEIEVSDAGGLSTTQPVTIIVDDINDNPMKPASKIVYLWKTQGGGSEASLGRVYVEDPDDWDLEDKTFSWHGAPHSLFSLHEDTGAIYASAHVREGRYDLQFSVSDRAWGQTDIRANVTVDVRYLHPDALTHALPLTLTPITPATLTTGWSPKRGGGGGGGGLGTLAKAVKDIVGSPSATVEIVSVYGHPDSDAIYSATLPKATPLVHSPVSPFACVWLSVRQTDGTYMDPVKLQGLLSLHNRKLEKAMSVGVSLREPAGEAGFGASLISPSSVSNPQQPSSLASLASTALPLQVVDTNSTSLVTPRLSRSHSCPSHFEGDVSDSCTRTSCLNGGRCVRNSEGSSRCICPGGSFGRRCKIVSRTFEGNGWAWIHPFPPCLPTTLTLRILTRRPNALLLYSGPLSFSSTHPRYPTTPMLALQLVEGRPQVLMENARGSIRLQVDAIFEMGIWHTLHLHVDAQGVTLMVDLCDWGWVEGARDDAHCIARGTWNGSGSSEDWIGNDPIQLGGLSHSRPSPQQYGWASSPSAEGLEGCISHLTVNGQLIDLGEPAYSSNSWPGCRPQDAACKGKCGLNGRCTGGLANSWCDCDPGWAPPTCDRPTVPSSFGQNSYLKMAVSFIPDPYRITSQLRVRFLGRPDGLLMRLENHHRSVALVLRLRGGIVCASITSNKDSFSSSSPEACVDGYPLGDGSWHTVYAARHGPNLLLSVDDGDGWRHNHTLSSLLLTLKERGAKRPSKVISSSRRKSSSSSSSYYSSSSSSSPSSSASSSSSSPSASPSPFEKPSPLIVDKQNGVAIGGVPEYHDAKLLNVHNDAKEVCIDDVRIAGNGLPLAPGVNGTAWGQVTTFQNLEVGCPGRDLCSNTSCPPPMTCHNSWRQASCSCGPGRQLLGGSCQMVNECMMYQPCLHGGTCHDIHPGYRCSCQPYHSGHNCQWVHLPPHTHSVTPVVIAAITLSILVFVVIGVVVTLRLHKSRAGRSGDLRPTGVEDASEVGGIAAVIETPISAHCNKRKEEPVLLDALKLKVQAEHHCLEAKKSPSLSCKGSSGGKDPSHHSTSSLRRSTVGHDSAKDVITSSLKLPPRVTLCSSSSSDGGTCKAKSPPASTASPSGGGVGAGGGGGGRAGVEASRVAVICGKFSTFPPPVQDDLRAYAYEGDGSPSGSLTSATIGLQMELRDEEAIKPIVPAYGEVFNLLSTLPDAPYTKISGVTPQGTLTKKGSMGSSSISSISDRVSGAEKLRQDQQIPLTPMDAAAAARGPSDVTSKQTHVRRKSSLIGLSTAC